jgi:hypothetical protein
MSPRELEQPPPFTQSSSFRELFKKLIHRGQKEHRSEQLEEVLKRLALSAPHILADIGFERDLGACSAGRTIWRRGPLRVTISTVVGSVSISRS